MIVQAIYTSKYSTQNAFNEITYKREDITGKECFTIDWHIDDRLKLITQRCNEFVSSTNLSTIRDVNCVTYSYDVVNHKVTSLIEFEIDDLNDNSKVEIERVLDEIEYLFVYSISIGAYTSDSRDGYYFYGLKAIDIYHELDNKFKDWNSLSKESY